MTIAAEQLAYLDEKKLSSFHWKIVLTAGLGFFTDAYDLFVIGIVTALLKPIWHLTTFELALLNAGALASAAFGAVFFGFLADKYGRKKLYGLEVAILFFGAILSAISPSFIYLFVARFLVGLGIGGDYPCSAIITSETANTKNRGSLVLMVFGMQAFGLLVGPLIASLLLYFRIPADIVWRGLLVFGAIPAAAAFFMRRKISESPRYLAAQNNLEVSRVVTDLAEYTPGTIKPISSFNSLWHRPWLTYLIGTAGAWFFLDIAFYGNSVSSVLLLKVLNPSAGILNNTLLSGLIFLCFAFPGYIAAIFFIDKIGRKWLQTIGFGMMSLLFVLLGFLTGINNHIELFILLFGASYFFTNFGPNSTTFLIPSEIYPTSIRAQAHGLSAAIGKVGAFIGAFILPLVLQKEGLNFTMFLVALMCVLGILCTILIPEMKGKSLSSLEK